MPGIAGIISPRPAPDCERLLAAMIASMMHERSYESGTCSVPEMGVYAGWTAHRQSAVAHHPAASGCGDTIVVLSGECLADRRHPHRAPNDGFDGIEGREAIAARYDDVGERFVPQLNGLFSGLLIDRRQRRTLLFNDRYGIDRLYVHEGGDATYFASEAKALLSILPELRAFDDDAVSQFLAFGCTLNWQSLFRGVRVLEGGSLWSFRHGECRKTRYFVPGLWQSQPPLTAESFEREFEETFRAVLPGYVDSGRQVGISLTGGLDTRMIMACLTTSRQPICYTFSGLDGETLDDRLAARVAAACGLEHRIIRIGPDFLSQYGSYVDRTVHTTDACSGALGAHEIYFNAQARQLAPVRLTGNYGSEVLRSVSTFKPLGLSRHLFQTDLGRTVAAWERHALGVDEHPVAFAAFREIPWSLFGSLAAGRSQLAFRTPYLDNNVVALAFRAPARSLQSSRPALHLVGNGRPELRTIPTDRGLGGESHRLIQIMRHVAAEVTFKLDYYHTEGLPARLAPLTPVLDCLSKTRLVGLHKFLKYSRWFRRELAPYIIEVVTDDRTSRLPYFDRDALRAMPRDHASGRQNYVGEINAVLTLEAADRLIIRSSAESQHVPCVTVGSASTRG